MPPDSIRSNIDRIMLVDDNPQALEDWGWAMTGAGLESEAFSGAKEALDAMKSGKRYSVVLLDILMPEMNGIDFLHALREHQEDVEVIVITAVKELETATEAMRLGAVDYLIKECPLELIVQVVQKALATRKLKQHLAELALMSREVSAEEAMEGAAHQIMVHVATGLDVASSYLMIGLGEQRGIVLASQGFSSEQTKSIADNVRDGVERLLLQQPVPEPIVISDTSADERCLRHIRDIRSCILVPMVHSRVVEGAILVGHAQEFHFSERNDDDSIVRRTVQTVDFLSVIASQMAVIASLARKARRLMDAEIKTAEEQAKLKYLKSCFAGIAHEAKNPLWYISARAQLLKEELPTDSPIREDVEVIDQQTQRIDNLFHEVIDLTMRSEVVEESHLDLNAIVTETLIAAKVTGQTEGNEITPDLSKEPLPILGDALQLKRALSNVLANAAERSKKVIVCTRVAVDSAEVEIENERGTPIPAEDWETIFSPFASVEKARFPGEQRGFGLAVARGVIVGHKGMLSVKESNNQKTVFLATLPLRKEVQQ